MNGYFPLLIAQARYNEMILRIIKNPSDLPTGSAFTVLQDQATDRDLVTAANALKSVGKFPYRLDPTNAMIPV